MDIFFDDYFIMGHYHRKDITLDITLFDLFHNKYLQYNGKCPLIKMLLSEDVNSIIIQIDGWWRVIYACGK